MDEREGGADEIDAATAKRWSLGTLAVGAIAIGGVAGAVLVLGDSPQVMPEFLADAGDASTMQSDQLLVERGEIDDFLDEHATDDWAGGTGQRHKGEEGKMGTPTPKRKSGLYAMKGPDDSVPQSGGLGLVGTGRGGGGVGEGTIGSGGRDTHMTHAEMSGGDGYASVAEQDFVAVADDAKSTFSIDVDTASYSNTRRMIAEGSLPPTEAVRIEEYVNYFDYEYEQPSGDVPFSVTTEVGPCPWNAKHKLVHVGLQGREIDQSEVPARNLVFLVDVSGSMQSPDRLPLLVRSLELLVDQLRPEDRVGMVVYAGASGVVLEPTSGDRRADIKEALQRLESGGSTNGGAGIELAYRLAQQNFVEGGINRVVLATDGDFNVGLDDHDELKSLVEAKRKSGVFLSVLGFGRGNLKDDTMELLADKGNGNYAYIDSIDEAKKVLVDEAGGTLVTIAKDVKLQIEMNPAEVAQFRLIGYDNRRLAHQDFADDTKDAGEIGAGHSVTAIYEIVPAEGASASRGEMMTIALRYKAPDGDKSRAIEHDVIDRDVALAATSDDFRFSAAVVEMGLLLRRSAHAGAASWTQVVEMAAAARGKDRSCLRGELVDLAQRAAKLAGAEVDRVKTCAS
jgi:Ca-activated chloride channel family protein